MLLQHLFVVARVAVEQLVRERLVDISLRRKPDLDRYLDGASRKREVTPELAQPPLTLESSWGVP